MLRAVGRGCGENNRRLVQVAAWSLVVVLGTASGFILALAKSVRSTVYRLVET